MGDYLKLFETDSERVEYEGGGSYIEPYVSYVEEDNSVHYNKFVETRLIATYNVEDASNKTLLYGYEDSSYAPKKVIGTQLFDNIEIDGTNVSISDLDAARGQCQLSVGEHVVKYTFKNPTIINDGVFCNCKNMSNVIIPNIVTSIGDIQNSYLGAFSSCSGLTSVTISNSVTNIGSNAFNSCTSLASVTIGSGVTNIGNGAFSSCSGLTSVTISNSVTNIGNGAFSSCSGLTSVTIPDSVTSIGESAFSRCSGLTTATIGNGIIGNYAFDWCNGLTSVTIGSGVTSIGNWAFRNCQNLGTIISSATQAPTVYSQTFLDVKRNGTLYVPQSSIGYDAWMSSSSYYLGYYNWTKVEQ